MPHAPHEILGIDPNASRVEARAAYRRLALCHHPDHNPGDPSANERFQRVLDAYRAHRADAARRPEPPRGPRPDRYGCGGCGDTFPFPLRCPRCDVELQDRSQGEPHPIDDPEVLAYERWLDSRPAPGPSLFDRVPVPGLIAASCFAAGFGVAKVGPLGVAFLFVGFAVYVIGVEAHRRILAARAR